MAERTRDELLESIRNGRYKPSPVRRVEIPKDNGGVRKLGMPDWMAYRNGNTRKGYWAVAGSGILKTTITNERLARRGYYDISEAYKSLHYL